MIGVVKLTPPEKSTLKKPSLFTVNSQSRKVYHTSKVIQVISNAEMTKTVIN